MTSTCSACEGDNHNWGPRHHALIASLKEADASLRAECERLQNMVGQDYQRAVASEKERDSLREQMAREGEADVFLGFQGTMAYTRKLKDLRASSALQRGKP